MLNLLTLVMCDGVNAMVVSSMSITPVRCLLSALVISLLLASCNAAASASAEQGFFDLTGQAGSYGKPVLLHGGWEFYWNRLLEPGDFIGGRPPGGRIVNLPSYWNNYHDDKGTLPGYGYATYRLIVRVPFERDMSLSSLHANTSYRIWINGSLVSRAGTVGRTSETARPHQNSENIPFRSRNGENEIIIQVSNFSYNLGGLWDKLYIGERSEIERRQKHSIAYELFLFGSLLIIGFYHIILFVFRRGDRAPLFFGIFSLLVALRILVTNEMYLTQLFPNLPFETLVKLNFLSFTLAGPFFIAFLSLQYRDLLHRRVKYIIFSVCGAYSAAVIVFSAGVYSRLLLWFDAFLIVAGVYAFTILIRAVSRRMSGSILDISGFTILFLALANDVLAAMGFISSTQLSPLGLLIFIIAESANISRRFSQAFTRVEELTGRLEEKVRERTEELSHDRDILKDRNTIIENDLKLARRIQKQMIPQGSPYPWIHALYQPMEMVGGDFFDYFEFRNPSRIGIFVSDVSGHGMSAAFITSMVKTMTLQSGDVREDPASLLHYLNGLLHGKTAENFITAFYGVYDPDDRSLV
ncbi:MAG: hypothetical protein E4G96_04045, partial [Chrysiogenales bacterium]